MPVGHVALGWVQDLHVERAIEGEVVGGWRRKRSASDLIDDLELGSRVVRYTRTWIMGRSGYQDSDVWGKVGFVSGDATEVWDEVEGDFREIESPTGASSPFVVNAATGRLAFQFRPGVIERTAYCGALEALANRPYLDAEQPRRWRIWADLGDLPWDEWIEEAGPIQRLSFTIKLPNPNWRGREKLKELVTDANSTLMRLVYETDDPDGLDIDETVIRQAIAHTVEKGYGVARAEAFRTTAPKFDSKKRSPAAEVTIDLAQGSRDVGPESLRAVADDRAASSEQPKPPPRRLPKHND